MIKVFVFKSWFKTIIKLVHYYAATTTMCSYLEWFLLVYYIIFKLKYFLYNKDYYVFKYLKK